jgi:organic radical activating enzyme
MLAAYPLMEDFYTVQGEGFHSGRAAYFMRLGGCDVGCHWCDVKESWDADAHPVTSASDLLMRVRQTSADFCVVTGGEPAMYDLAPFTDVFREAGMEMAIETSGVYELTGSWHWVCFSPKKFKKPVDSIYQLANELKVVIFHPSDFSWAEEHAARVNADCKLYLQPEWSKSEAVLPLIVDYVKKNPKWNISLQTHKYMNIP